MCNTYNCTFENSQINIRVPILLFAWKRESMDAGRVRMGASQLYQNNLHTKHIE